MIGSSAEPRDDCSLTEVEDIWVKVFSTQEVATIVGDDDTHQDLSFIWRDSSLQHHSNNIFLVFWSYILLQNVPIGRLDP